MKTSFKKLEPAEEIVEIAGRRFRLLEFGQDGRQAYIESLFGAPARIGEALANPKPRGFGAALLARIRPSSQPKPGGLTALRHALTEMNAAMDEITAGVLSEPADGHEAPTSEWVRTHMTGSMVQALHAEVRRLNRIDEHLVDVARGLAPMPAGSSE